MPTTSPANPNSPVPLCVDLDGTLIAGDTTVLAIRALLRAEPWAVPGVFWTLRRGRAFFKDALCARVTLRPEALPFRAEVVAFLRGERAAGRTLVLATAANIRLAAAIADHLGMFQQVLASDAGHNRKGAAKADALLRAFGMGGFDYMGNDRADLPVWTVARRAYVVSGDSQLVSAVRRVAHVAQVFRE